MKKRIMVMGLILSACVSVFGCKSGSTSTKDETTTGVESTSGMTEQITEQTTEDLQDNVTDNAIYVDRDTKEDGSVYVKVTNGKDVVFKTVEYVAGEDKTIKCIYEYNENGQLITETCYEGKGNRVDEFYIDVIHRDATETIRNYGENGDTDNVVTVKKEEKEDGSVYVRVTDKDQKVLQIIKYIASERETSKFEFEYNEKGKVSIAYHYYGTDNLVKEFQDGDYRYATSTGFFNYENDSDYLIDLDRAYEATIEELTPLYKRAEEIYNKYGVHILIGDKAYEPAEGAELCYDYKQISDCLEIVENCIKCYPKDFFRAELNSRLDYNVCIQLVGTNGPAGAYIQKGKYKIIQIDVNCYQPDEPLENPEGYFSYTLHHEIGHFISDVLLSTSEMTEIPLTEELWNELNPEGFQYVGYYDSEKEAEYYDSITQHYFIEPYSCSTPGEDRSTIFGKAMEQYQSNLSYGLEPNIDAKLEFFSKCIKSGFYWVDWNEKPAWEYILEY